MIQQQTISLPGFPKVQMKSFKLLLEVQKGRFQHGEPRVSSTGSKSCSNLLL